MKPAELRKTAAATTSEITAATATTAIDTDSADLPAGTPSKA